MDDLKKIGFPILLIWLSAFSIKVLKTYFNTSLSNTIISLVMVITLFFFGFLLNKNRKRRSESVFKKVVSILVLILLYLMQYGYLNNMTFYNIFNIFGINEYFINMIYILCGYIFGD